MDRHVGNPARSPKGEEFGGHPLWEGIHPSAQEIGAVSGQQWQQMLRSLVIPRVPGAGWHFPQQEWSRPLLPRGRVCCPDLKAFKILDVENIFSNLKMQLVEFQRKHNSCKIYFS